MFSILSHELSDHGFYINLDHSVERKVFIENQISLFDIKNLSRFPALTDELRQYSCTKSHRAVFEFAISQNMSSVFVAEDDFDIRHDVNIGCFGTINIKEFLGCISSYIKKENFDILMFGCNPRKQIIPINRYLGLNTSSTGAWAYIINQKAMKYILNNYNYSQDYMAIDDILPDLNYKGFKTLTTIPQIMNHRDGVASTLQPSIGPTHYSGWIEGNWNKHLYESISKNILNKEDFYNYLENNYIIENNMTILITGHSTENWLYYLRYLLKSLPKKILNCRFIVCYDNFSNEDQYNLNRYFRDVRSDIQPSIEYVNGGLISSLKKCLPLIQTPYFLWLEHDWVFLKEIEWQKLINTMNSHSFINAVWFNKDDNNIRGFDICDDIDGSVTAYEVDNRIKEISLITTCRWSNNPVLLKTQKMKDWFEKYITNEYIDILHQGQSNIEESLIPKYRSDIKNYGWNNIKDQWGTYLYGNIGDGPYVAHTDASRRYQNHNKSQPEINGEYYIINNPLSDTD